MALSVLLNVLIVLSEAIAGILSGSLALLSDAIHNLQDVLALVISLVALHLMGKGPTPTSTYGYRRAESLGAFVGSLMLLLSVLYVSYEAVLTLLSGHREVMGLPVVVVGGIAAVVNGVSAYLLHGGRDLNVRSAYLHLLGDTAFSVAVVLGGVAMLLTGWSALDSVLTLLFAPVLVKDGLSLLVSSARILMEFSPKGYDSQTVAGLISSADGVKEVHDVHVWALTSSEPYVSAHVVVEGNPPANEIGRLLKEIEGKLRRAGIKHVTLQVEPEGFPCRSRCP